MEYIEMMVEGRLCYALEEDLRIVYMLSSRTTGAPKKFEDIPVDAFIVKLLFVRKWQTGRKTKTSIIMEQEKQRHKVQKQIAG